MSSVHWSDTVRPGEGRRRPAPDFEFADAVSPLSLARLIEGEIIPRLLVAHRAVAAPAPPQLDIETCVEMALGSDPDALSDWVTRAADLGAGADDLLVDVLSPAARSLGVMWEEDLCSFTDVTVGLCRLQQAVYDLSDRAGSANDARGEALFAAAPGDQHAFGVVVVSEVFRRAGWRTLSRPDSTVEDLLDCVATEPFALIGLSLCNRERVDNLAALIPRLRAAALDPDAVIMVGGHVFNERPELCAEIGADATAADARAALSLADRLAVRPAHVT